MKRGNSWLTHAVTAPVVPVTDTRAPVSHHVSIAENRRALQHTCRAIVFKREDETGGGGGAFVVNCGHARKKHSL
jgi:hypothetical protein